MAHQQDHEMSTTYRTAWERLIGQDRARQAAEIREINHQLQLGFAQLQKAKLELQIITGKPYKPLMNLDGSIR